MAGLIVFVVYHYLNRCGKQVENKWKNVDNTVEKMCVNKTTFYNN